ncbi:MAG: GPW/gp25 family protein [Leptothrix sp. (in: b-proteobacteria)]
MARDKTSGPDVSFLGRGWTFPPAFELQQRRAMLVSQVPDIEESLRILFATNPGERVMQPSYGCGLKRMVFEPLNESTLTEMRSTIEKAVLFFEARITLDAVSFDVEDAVQGVLRIHLDYTVRTTNSRYNMVYPLYLQEGHGAREALE